MYDEQSHDGRASSLGLLLLLALAVVAFPRCATRKQADVTGFADAAKQYAHGQRLLARGKRLAASDVFGSVQYQSPDERKTLEPLVRLGLADATFYQSDGINLIDARSLYLDFVTLYLDHPLAPYAQFQAGMCSLRQASHPAKDQTLTYRAVEDFHEVERRFPASIYAGAARTMVRVAEAHLAEHEFIVARFYQSKKEWIAAADRYRTVIERYPDFGEREKVYFHLAETLLSADNPAEGKAYLDKLVNDFPAGRYADMARKELRRFRAGAGTDVARSPP